MKPQVRPPENWRVGNVVPLLKKGTKENAGNYRQNTGETGDVFYTTMVAPALRQHIEHLKCHLNDLQDANDSMINELTKADEEISQLRHEIAELKAKRAEELQLVKQEGNYFKNKFNKLCSAASQNTVKYNTADLLEQIQQLRNESRKLREMNHTLDEENHQLKEILWDLKQQNKWLPKEQFKGKMLSSEITIKENRTISGTKGQMCAKESETIIQKMSSLPSRLHCISSPSQISFEYFNIEDKISPIKSNENKMISDQRLKSCDGSMLDLDGLSEDDTSLPNQNNPHQQFQIAHCSCSNLCQPMISPSDFRSSCLDRNKTSRSLVDKAALRRRPFAPRSIADLSIGHLVKFSRPAGKIGKGVIKYLGHLPGRQEAYIGVELEGTEIGQHNGTFEGVRYFMCKKNKGVFVNFSKVIMAWD
ncbi:centrosome-associated protein 350-like isoform X6 [Mobula hypostoma]|uniref:centrosome-associated protein 350-like isoform X6 n=1 Tax=Mobula hypostoma TaxID=723540 RepID=UPI002FC368C2